MAVELVFLAVYFVYVQDICSKLGRHNHICVQFRKDSFYSFDLSNENYFLFGSITTDFA